MGTETLTCADTAIPRSLSKLNVSIASRIGNFSMKGAFKFSTLAAAVFVGLIAKQFNRFMTPFSQKLLGISEKKQSADLSEGSEKEQDTGTTEN